VAKDKVGADVTLKAIWKSHYVVNAEIVLHAEIKDDISSAC